MPLISSIPKDFEEGFKELATISNADFKSLVEALAKAEHYPNLANFSEALEVENEDLEIQVGEIIDSIGSLQLTVESKDIIDEVVEDVTFLAENLDYEEGKTSFIKEVFKERLKILLDVQKIYYAAKADSLIMENMNSGDLIFARKDCSQVFSPFEMIFLYFGLFDIYNVWPAPQLNFGKFNFCC